MDTSFTTLLPGLRKILFVAALAIPGASQAAITQVDFASFSSLFPGKDVFNEDLEIYPEGAVGTTLPLRNSQYSVNSGTIIVDEIFVLGTGLTNVLINSTISGQRSFSLFAIGTLAWGVDLNLTALGSDHQTFRVDVVGNSGSETFFFDLDSFDTYFAGFHDPLGLTSVTFENLGFDDGSGLSLSNYRMDNMTSVSVPLPAGLVLFLSGLGLFGWLARR